MTSDDNDSTPENIPAAESTNNNKTMVVLYDVNAKLGIERNGMDHMSVDAGEEKKIPSFVFLCMSPLQWYTGVLDVILSLLITSRLCMQKSIMGSHTTINLGVRIQQSTMGID